MSQPFLPIDGPSVRPGANTTTFVENMRLPVHRWFRYSAGFSATWAASVIEDSGAENVLDPFGGAGTAVLASEGVGVASIGVDVHPFVTRVAKAKLAWRADPDILVKRANEVRLEAEKERPVVEPSAPLIAKCFPDSGTLFDLLRVRDAVERMRIGDEYDELLWLAFVSIIRACSPAGTAQWQYVLPNKTKSRVAEPLAAFQARVEIFAEDMWAMHSKRSAPEGILVEADARTLDGVPDGWADLIVTSPPYANNFDYADATRLEQSFLGEITGWGDLKQLRKKLMKSATQHMGRWDSAVALESPLIEPIRAELLAVFDELSSIKHGRAGNKAYDLMVAGYFFDSAQIWHALRRASSPGVKVCYVVGDSAPYGVHVPVERWLGELALAAGFKKWWFEKVRDRNTRWKNRKHDHPPSRGSTLD